MKQLTSAVLIGGFLILFMATAPQEKKMDEKKHQQMTEMMKDSTMVNMMMEHIAKDDHLHKRMIQKMTAACKSDTSKMMGMCKMMMEDKDMHSMMMKMMDGGEMKHDMMEKNSESMKEPDKKDRHEEHHKNNGKW